MRAGSVAWCRDQAAEPSVVRRYRRHDPAGLSLRRGDRGRGEPGGALLAVVEHDGRLVLSLRARGRALAGRRFSTPTRAVSSPTRRTAVSLNGILDALRQSYSSAAEKPRRELGVGAKASGRREAMWEPRAQKSNVAICARFPTLRQKAGGTASVIRTISFRRRGCQRKPAEEAPPGLYAPLLDIR
jgi:hypothetical protein